MADDKRINLAAHLKDMPEVWDRPPQSARARTCAKRIRQDVAKGVVIDTEEHQWMDIYEKAILDQSYEPEPAMDNSSPVNPPVNSTNVEIDAKNGIIKTGSTLPSTPPLDKDVELHKVDAWAQVQVLQIVQKENSQIREIASKERIEEMRIAKEDREGSRKEVLGIAEKIYNTSLSTIKSSYEQQLTELRLALKDANETNKALAATAQNAHANVANLIDKHTEAAIKHIDASGQPKEEVFDKIIAIFEPTLRGLGEMVPTLLQYWFQKAQMKQAQRKAAMDQQRKAGHQNQ